MGLHEWAKHHPGQALPTLILFLYYHSRKPFNQHIDVYQLFSSPDQARHFLNHPILIDLHHYTDQQLLQHSGISGAEIAFRHAFCKQSKVDSNIEDFLLKGVAEMSGEAKC